MDDGTLRQSEGTAKLPEAVVVETIRESAQLMPSLGADQVQMVAGLATSGAGVECVEAGPGSGKTTALGIYVAACRRAGVRVIGCAPSAQARDELRQGARLEPCYTMAKLLLELEQDRLAPGSVIIVDEASMAGTRPLAKLLEHARRSEAKVVLVGDTKQLSSVDAGGGFRGLVRRLGAHQLTENRRQEAEWERIALRQLRDEKVEAALRAYADHGRLHIGDREELLPEMLEGWWTARPTGDVVMLAVRWRDVVELNQLARDRLVGAGVVEQDGLDVRGMTIGVGDRVIVMRNARELGVINGTTGTVVEVDRDAGDLVIETTEPEPRRIELPKEFWAARGRRRLAPDYCRTVHKAQGATYRGVSFTLAGDDCIHLESAHVALSRATETNHLYYVGEPPPHEEHHVPEVDAPALPGLVVAVGRSRAQVLALDILQQMEPPTPQAPARPDGGWDKAPMTEAQVATLARLGAEPERDLTWVEASLLIDDATGQPQGRRAGGWLQERGLSQEQADEVIEAAKRSLRQPSVRRLSTAVGDRLEQVEASARRGRPLSAGRRQEQEALKRWQTGASRNRQRQQRRQWAERPQAVAPQPPAAPETDRQQGRRPRPQP